MSLLAPWALLGLLAVPALWALHRFARPAGERPFSAFFLLERVTGEGRRGAGLRAPWLFAARLLAVIALAVAAAGPASIGEGGTALLAAGPVQVDARWPTPLTFVRAGRPPTVADAPADIAPVLGPPDWAGAALLAAQVAPGARVIRAPAPPSPEGIIGADAALDGAQVAVAAAVTGPGRPLLRIGDATWPMQPRNGDWFVRGVFPPGPAVVQLEDGSPGAWPICVPDARPLVVADAGWPPAVEAVLRVLPDVVLAPAAEADWRPGPAPPRHAGLAVFAPTTTFFEFADTFDRSAAPLWFDAALPPPGAVATRWHPLDGSGTPLLYAGAEVVVDRGAGLAGASVRFGFDPAASDLPETAGWPVLFAEMAAADRATRARCGRHEAGRPLVIATDDAVTVRDPAGHARRLTPEAGLIALDGLDRLGHYTLEGSRPATIAVVPGPARVASAVPFATPSAAPRPARRFAVFVALFALAAALALRRARAFAAWLALLVGLSALLDARLGVGPPGRVVLAVDTSASMPAAETAAAVAAVEAALGDRAVDRVEGADSVGALRERRTAPGPFAGDTRHGPLLGAAARLADEGGAIVLITDGRAEDAPVPLDLPVFPFAPKPTRPDARVVEARALRLGDRVFVRARLAADAPVAATARLGDVTLPVPLDARAPRLVHAVLPDWPADTLEVRVDAPGDRLPGNDRLPVVIEGESAPQAAVVGAAGVPWAAAAGLRPVALTADGLLEAGGRLTQARAMIVHDQPASSFAGPVFGRLQRWVEAGGVLLLAGRTQAFGPGGWGGTPLDALSPLQADPRPPGAGRLALALLLDRSGSIAEEAGGVGPEALGALAGHLGSGLRPDDQLTVLAFGGDVELLLPPTPVAELGDRALPVPARARGGTRLGPAIRRAVEVLTTVTAERRVIAVVSDGRIADADEAPALLAPLHEAGVALVAVLVGPDPERAALAALAAPTGGRLVETPTAAALRLVSPAVVTAGDALLADGGPVQVDAAWAGRVGGRPPPVAARVRTRARDAARVIARVGGDPLLAEWSLGRGRVMALATDAFALDAEQWAALFSPAVAPRPADAALSVRDGRLWYEGPVTDPPPAGTVRIQDARGRTHERRFHLDGPGRAWTDLPEGPVEVLEVSSPSSRGAVLTRLVRPPSPEVQTTGPAPERLALQAAITGGQILTAPDALDPVFAARGHRGGVPWPLCAALLAIALVLLDAARWAGARFGIQKSVEYGRNWRAFWFLRSRESRGSR